MRLRTELERSFAHLGLDRGLEPGTALPQPQGVFPRYLEEEEGADAG